MSNKKEDYYIYSHNIPHIQTMGDFAVESDSLGVGLDIAQLLMYQDENGNFKPWWFSDELSKDSDQLKFFVKCIPLGFCGLMKPFNQKFSRLICPCRQ